MAENKVSDTVNDMVNSMVEDINSAQNGSNKVSAIKDNVGYDMSRVHSANLKILKEIDRICRKYKIQYALDAGTLIGAVRHKGFIPWDDDADIVFTRNQFEAFKKVVRRELPDTMELVEPDSFHGGKAFFDFTPRIIYKKSRMHPDSDKMDYYDGKLNHLWVDLFIMDKLPKGKAAAEITRFLHKAVYGLAMGHRHDLDYTKYSLMYKVFVGGLATIGKFIPMKAIFFMQKAIALKDRHSKGDLRYYSNYQPDYLYVTLHKDWCEEVIDAPFEDTTLMIPKGWDPVLKEVYGDYMQLPPEEKRVPTHSSLQIQVYD